MNVAVIGLGEIAKKAYLPVVMSRGDAVPYLLTRDRAVLMDVGQRFRIPEARRFHELSPLLEQPLDAAFVHAATEAHVEIVSALMRRGIPVYVDKPLDMAYQKCQALVKEVQRDNRLLLVGFNRRRAPWYRRVKMAVSDPSILVMQKNRAASPQETRTVIYDDFIHVIDTVRYLVPGAIDEMSVQGRWMGEELSSVAVTFSGSDYVALGAMNRVNGADEELLDVMGSGCKWRVEGMRRAVCWHDQKEESWSLSDWTPISEVKGFSAIVDEFLTMVEQKDFQASRVMADDALETHRVCEAIVERLERQRLSRDSGRSAETGCDAD